MEICTSLMAKQAESGLMRCGKFLQRRQRRKQNTSTSSPCEMLKPLEKADEANEFGNEWMSLWWGRGRACC